MSQQNDHVLEWQSRVGLSPKEVMRLTGWSRSFTYKSIHHGEIRAIRIGPRKLIIPVTEVEKLLKV